MFGAYWSFSMFSWWLNLLLKDRQHTPSSSSCVHPYFLRSMPSVSACLNFLPLVLSLQTQFSRSVSTLCACVWLFFYFHMYKDSSAYCICTHIWFQPLVLTNKSTFRPNSRKIRKKEEDVTCLSAIKFPLEGVATASLSLLVLLPCCTGRSISIVSLSMPRLAPPNDTCQSS